MSTMETGENVRFGSPERTGLLRRSGSLRKNKKVMKYYSKQKELIDTFMQLENRIRTADSEENSDANVIQEHMKTLKPTVTAVVARDTQL